MGHFPADALTIHQSQIETLTDISSPVLNGELGMDTRYLLAGSAALAIAGAAAAAPAEPQAKAPATRPAEIVLASAEQAREVAAPVEQEQAAVPTKRPRAARVTSCRCAGQTQQPTQADQ